MGQSSSQGLVSADGFGQDEALARDGVSREVPCSALKGETVPDSAAKSLQLCPTLCNPIDGNPPGSPVPGILQARTLEWVAISFSNA